MAFRGTDITILGWKENFNMTYLDEVPAQRDSVKYVNRVFELHKLPLYIGGHSKGGNLALYSAINSDDKINDFIIKVHNFDGPGYNTDISYNEKFILLKDKILTFTTQKAIIGVLMYYVDNLIFIGAKGISLLQHVSYQWKVDKGGLLHRVKRNSLQSRFFARSIRYFFENTSEYERKRFVDLVFTIIEVSPSNSVKIFKRHPFNFIGKMRRRYKGISKDDKRFFKSVLKKFRFSFFMALKVKLSELRG